MVEIYFPLVRNFVDEVHQKAGKAQGLRHFDRTVYWLKQLKPEADEALLIAAYAHDIERAYRDSTYNKIDKSEKGFQDKGHLIYHQETGAKIMSDFLIGIEAPVELIARVAMLISKHEIGGNPDQNLLKDADSVSFLETQVDHFVTEQVAVRGKEKVKEKFDWMYNRITSPNAEEVAKPWYHLALSKLGY
ncbi:MAG: DUF4202 family protein [Patescibacteria group bacterium]